LVLNARCSKPEKLKNRRQRFAPKNTEITKTALRVPLVKLLFYAKSPHFPEAAAPANRHDLLERR